MIDQAALLSILKEHANKSDDPKVKDFFKSGITREDWEKAISEGEIVKLS